MSLHSSFRKQIYGSWAVCFFSAFSWLIHVWYDACVSSSLSVRYCFMGLLLLTLDLFGGCRFTFLSIHIILQSGLAFNYLHRTWRKTAKLPSLACPWLVQSNASNTTPVNHHLWRWSCHDEIDCDNWPRLSLFKTTKDNNGAYTLAFLIIQVSEQTCQRVPDKLCTHCQTRLAACWPLCRYGSCSTSSRHTTADNTTLLNQTAEWSLKITTCRKYR